MKVYSIVDYLDAKDVEASGFSDMVILFLLTCTRFKFNAFSFLFDRKTPHLSGMYQKEALSCRFRRIQ